MGRRGVRVQMLGRFTCIMGEYFGCPSHCGFVASLQILASQYEERLEELKVELQEARDHVTQLDSYHNELVMQVRTGATHS